MFITLEGIEGAGKTTQIPRLVEFLKEKGHDCRVTREPGGTPDGEKIRQMLLDPANQDLAPETELFLYAADRAQHVAAVILPALAAGKSVICDRFGDATEAYQGGARGIDRQLVARLNQVATRNLKPDLTILLDLPPEVGLARAWQRIKDSGRQADDCRFENEALDFHRRVRQAYLDIVNQEPARFLVVDAAGSAEIVWEKIRAGLEYFLNKQDTLFEKGPPTAG